MILWPLLWSPGAHSQDARPGEHPRFEPASAAVPAGNTCLLHPEGNSDAAQSIPIRADADGVARFLAVRPTLPTSVGRLTLECTDSDGNASTYSVDLRSEETFAPRPFDPSLAGLAVRPALTGDPQSYTQDELIKGGYGLRPDPTENADGYRQWRAAVSVPAYKLRSVARASVTPPRPRQLASVAPEEIPSANPHPGGDVCVDPRAADLKFSLLPSNYWTGAVLCGSYQKKATPALTHSYVWNSGVFTVPQLTPNGFATATTLMTIWTGLDNVFQAIVDVSTTTTLGGFSIHRQNFYNNDATSIDEQGVDFTPQTGDTILADEWYCDADGNVDLAGGYGCTVMIDEAADPASRPPVTWVCTTANGADCQSYTIASTFVQSGALGHSAEFIIEDDTGEIREECPSASTECYDEWPDFSPVRMSGTANVVQGTGRSGRGTFVSTQNDPIVQLYTDDTASVPYERGDGHLAISLLPTGGVEWNELQTNIYYWNGSNFNDLSTPQGTSQAPPGVIFACGNSIAVGPSSRGLTSGTPWITGCGTGAGGNRNVWQMQAGGAWVKMQDDIATHIAVSPEGDAWAINAAGDVLYWNGSEFTKIATVACATSIGVGPSSAGLPNGTPWITGCSTDAQGNHNVFQMQAGHGFVFKQGGIATQIAVSPEGNAWAINAAGNVLYWNGSEFAKITTVACATSIGVGPSTPGLANGTPWITGCSVAADGNHNVLQMQAGHGFVHMQSDVGKEIAVSPEGYPWAISLLM